MQTFSYPKWFIFKCPGFEGKKKFSAIYFKTFIAFYSHYLFSCINKRLQKQFRRAIYQDQFYKKWILGDEIISRNVAWDIEETLVFL